MTKRWITIASVMAFVLIVLSLLMNNLQKQYNRTTHVTSQSMLPGFSKQLDQIHQIRFSFTDNFSGKDIVLIKTQETTGQETWIVQADNYPVDLNKLNKFLLHLTESKRIEKKTKQPARFAKLGLNPGNAVKVRIDLQDGSATTDTATTNSAVAKDTTTITFDVGNDAANIDGTYVKFADQDYSWLVSGRFAADMLKTDWRNKQLFRIHQDSVQTISLMQKETQTLFTLSKENPQQTAFVLQPVSEKNSLAQNIDETVDATIDTTTANTLARIWYDFTWTDLRPVHALQAPEPQEIIEMTTFDGLKIQAQLLKVQNAYWVQFHAEMAETVPTQNAQNQRTQEQTRQDAQTIATKINAYSSWAYRFHSFKTDLFKTTRTDLLNHTTEAS